MRGAPTVRGRGEFEELWGKIQGRKVRWEKIQFPLHVATEDFLGG